jgi:hypothetical protein
MEYLPRDFGQDLRKLSGRQAHACSGIRYARLRLTSLAEIAAARALMPVSRRR